MDTRITRLLGIRYPIVQGGMQWVGRAPLSAAVSEAGGLGVVTGLTQPTPQALKEEIEHCRSLTAAPFGVNLTMLPTSNPPDYRAYLDTILDSGVRIVETAGNVPEAFITRAHEAKAFVIHKCTSVRHALAAQRRGVDVVSIDGFECAGHPGEDDIGGLVLIPIATSALDIPVIASGGIADGRGMAAALTLGAHGINMGTRFCATQEAPIHEHIKRLLVSSGERDTRLIFRTLRNTARCLKNAISDEVVRLEGRPGGAEFAELQPLVAGARGREALVSGEPDGGLIWAGQVVGLIKDLPTCRELVERTVRECAESLRMASRAFERSGNQHLAVPSPSTSG